MKNINEIIINDITDNDVYKFSMLYFLYKKDLLNEIVGWEFFNRGKTKFPVGFGKELQKQVDSWVNLKFTNEMLEHIEKTMWWLDKTFIWHFLKSYQLDPSVIKITSTYCEEWEQWEEIEVKYEGEWGQVILFETMLLPTMSELYNFMEGNNKKILPKDELDYRNIMKFMRMQLVGVKLIEFGTRRRYSKDNQEYVINFLKEKYPSILMGTSNLMFSKRYDLKPFGTHAHELIMWAATKYGVLSANEQIMKQWVEVFRGSLGLYLTDTYTTDACLKSFDLFYSKLYDGVREDSSPNIQEYTDKIISHYEKLRIDPKTKCICHSNGIDSIEKVREIQSYRKGEINKTLGIGTWLTNDLFPENSSLKPVNWVIKMTHVYHQEQKRYCVKLSDVSGKVTSISEETVNNYKFQLGF